MEETTPPATNAGRDHDGAEIDTLREQLGALETMYKEMLKVVGAKKREGKISSPRGNSGSLKKGPGVARSSSKVKRKSLTQRKLYLRFGLCYFVFDTLCSLRLLFVTLTESCHISLWMYVMTTLSSYLNSKVILHTHSYNVIMLSYFICIY